MQTRAQWEGSSGGKTAHGVTDWHALEEQLNRTRVILQEILLHLQEVLRNLKSVRTGHGVFCGATRTESAGRAKETSFTASGSGARAKTQTTSQFQSGREHTQGASSSKTTGTSDRFRTKTRQTVFENKTRQAGFETRFDAGSHARPGAANDKAKTENTRTFRTGATSSSSRTAGPAGGANRERPRTEHTRTEYTWRSKTTAQGGERTTRFTQTGASQRTTARPQGARTDQERQFRARQAARKSGMNLKCAYDILCIDYPCSADEIKSAYRQMARLHHPDLGGDEEVMKDVNVAYELAMRFCSGPRQSARTAWAV